MQSLRILHKKVKKLLERFGIKEPAFIISFAEKNTDYKKVFYISNMSARDSIRVLESNAEKIKSKQN